MLKTLFMTAIFASFSSLWASDFRLVTKDQSSAAQKLLKEADSIFPEEMKAVINTKILVKFGDLNGSEIAQINEACDQKLIMGSVSKINANKKEIVLKLDRVLLKGVEKVRAINCAHKDTLTYAKAMIVHELSHLYDHKAHLSKDQTFLNLTGWISKGLIFKKRTNLNKAMDRSPDPYEFKTPGESFAVNFEFFLLDKNYKCRRPSYYTYYSQQIGLSTHQNSDCKMNKKVTLVGQELDKKPTLTRDIDPSRIYQVHYLFAGKGKEMMSRWGHAMFRLVVCAPEREVGPECLQDFSHHVVISYRANVEDMTLDYKKGLDGEYASQLFLMNMSNVVDEYARGEFRDVISLPLQFTRDQVTLFTNKLLENYWSYKGSYFFLTNNCASEAMNLLRAAYPGNKKMQMEAITTPLGMYDFLVKKKIVDSSVLDNKKDAVYHGYLFPGISDKLMASFKMFVDDKTMDFETFALKLTASERKDLYLQALSVGKKERLILLGNALRLEDQILLSREKAFATKIGNALFGKEVSEDLKNTALDEHILEIRDAYKKLSAENFVEAGYGIPLKSEFRDVAAEIVTEVFALMQSRAEELKEIAVEFFPDEVNEMKACLENRFFILTEMAKREP